MELLIKAIIGGIVIATVSTVSQSGQPCQSVSHLPTVGVCVFLGQAAATITVSNRCLCVFVLVCLAHGQTIATMLFLRVAVVMLLIIV